MDLKEITNNIYLSPYDEKKSKAAIGYINGSRFSVMVDFGSTKKDIAEFEDEIARRHLKSPKLTVLTHSEGADPDYIKSLKSKTVSSLSTHNRIKEMINKENASAEKTCPNVGFSGKVLLRLGNLTCIAVELPSPYCDDCIGVFVKEEKTLFLADGFTEKAVRNHSFSTENAEKLKKILGILDFSQCILGHHSSVLNKKELIDFINIEIEKNTI